MIEEPRIAAWDRRVDWPLTVLAVLFLVGYAVQVLARPDAAADAAIETVLTAVWVLFGLDYAVRIALARRRWRFVLTHLLDLVVLLAPLLRPLWALRVITVINVLNRQLRDDVRGRVAVYVTGAVALVGFVAALAVLDAERDAPGASITTLGDAVWWTLTTISTVGYGDRFPITAEGRLVAAALMVAGIALLGVVTGTFASWFVDALRRSEQRSAVAADAAAAETAAEGARVTAQLAEVLDELRTVSTRLAKLERSSAVPSSAPPHGSAVAAPAAPH